MVGNQMIATVGRRAIVLAKKMRSALFSDFTLSLAFF
jgi:hypothetical protein